MTGTVNQAPPERESAFTHEAALRRVAMLVARESSPMEIFAAVTEEAARVFEGEAVGLLRFEADDTATLVAQSDTPWEPPPLGTSLPLDGENLVTELYRTGRAARADDWQGSSGAVAAMASVLGVRSAIASPVVVQGRLWGTIIVATSQGEPLPQGTESRIAEFTELVATAIANAQARGELSRLVEEQAALRRVAVLVSQQPSPDEVFAAVTEVVGPLLGADLTAMHVFRGDGMATVVASWSQAGPTLPIGARLPLHGDSAVARIFTTGAAARIDSYDDAEGETAGVARGLRLRSTVGATIVVDGKLWGALMAATRGEEPLPADAETRIAAFTELVATAVANAQAREELQRLADEQGALRRVATLVATEASHGDVFSAIAEGVANVVGEELRLVRFEGELAVVVAGSQGPHNAVLPVGTRIPLGGTNALTRVYRTGKPVRIDDYSTASGQIAEAVRPTGLRSIVATPIVAGGRTWGAMLVASYTEEPVPPETEGRLGQFAELMATAIANAEARVEVERLAEQQASLGRVATLVARGVAPEVVFRSVADEAGRLPGADFSALVRLESGDAVTVMAGPRVGPYDVGDRVTIDPGFVIYAVRETGRAARFETDDPTAEGMPVLVRRRGIRSAVASPIVVEGALWGAVILGARGASLPPETEQRLDEFTELVATAISNATARADLVASRARIVAAGDEARRRIERNLHDSTQQRLIAVGLDVQRARATLPDEQGDTHSALAGVEQDLESILVDLRELSHGLHPSLLSRLGLGPSLQALARRSPIPVQVDVQVAERPSESLETAVYYIVSEAVTNAIKHSQASEISVTVSCGTTLRASIVDDGVGGADASAGSGLTGLVDRVDALGGRFALDSPPRGGTRISIELPIS